MSDTNNTDIKKEQSFEQKKVIINTIQRTALVERLCIDKSRYYYKDDIIPYDHDNLYPNKIKAIAQRSGTTKSSIKTLASFISGEGFEGMDTELNKNKQTGWDILRFVTKQYSTFAGFALHFNYNVFGEIAEITPVPFEFVRWSGDEKKLIVNSDWGKGRRLKKNEKVYYPFNPENVQAEIEEAGGFDNYEGQVYYWIEDKQDIYTVCLWDEVLDDAQLEAEIKLYSLSSIQNDYALSGILSYPAYLESLDTVKQVIYDIRQDIGAGNAGGVRLFPVNPTEDLRGWKWFTPVSRNNIDNLFENQKETAKFNIYACFRQPPILNGVVKTGMFNKESFADAFEYYNTATETERKDIEKELTKIFEFSIWSELTPIQIIPKSFIVKEETNKKEENGEVTD